MAQFQSYNKLLISAEEGIENYGLNGKILGWQFRCQYPSYRGTYLSCIHSMEVYLDGERVPDGDILFYLNGKEFLLSEFPDLYKEYWFILDKAVVRVQKDGGLPAGSSHRLLVKMKHLIPYTGYFGNYLVLDGSNEKMLTVAEKEEAVL
ncbi:MAG: DUF6379 domain-containing protein [Lachnospiraceae bacterium]|jgi:hypothetical protein|nr:DUF6379 domain-containing protein [Lachnospiraceae bacterium]